MLFLGCMIRDDPRQTSVRLLPGSLTKTVDTAAKLLAVVSIATGTIFMSFLCKVLSFALLLAD